MGLYVEGSPLGDQLLVILQAFTMARPDVGYVQGMSYIAGLILLYLDPYYTFQLLTNVISSPSILPIFRMSEEAL